MSPGLSLVFWSLVLFEVKHFFGDFVAQSRYQLRHKGIYGLIGGFMHAGVHGIASIPAVLVMTRSAPVIAAVVFGEFLFHYHVDWLKEQINKRYRLTYENQGFWTLFGADQLLHHLTYVVILAILARQANL